MTPTVAASRVHGIDPRLLDTGSPPAPLAESIWRPEAVPPCQFFSEPSTGATGERALCYAVLRDVVKLILGHRDVRLDPPAAVRAALDWLRSDTPGLGLNRHGVPYLTFLFCCDALNVTDPPRLRARLLEAYDARLAPLHPRLACKGTEAQVRLPRRRFDNRAVRLTPQATTLLRARTI